MPPPPRSAWRWLAAGATALVVGAAVGKVSGTVALKRPLGTAPILSIDFRAQGVTSEAIAAMACVARPGASPRSGKSSMCSTR
jgi:hypothetical protein